MNCMLKVLIVDDYDSMMRLVQRYLKRSGCDEVRAVSCPYEALALARREHFDLIISDHDMPGMTGLQFLAAIRADPFMSQTRFIMLTCSDDRELLRQAMALGADAFHTKPIAEQTLCTSVMRLGGVPALGRMIASPIHGRIAPSRIAPRHFGRATGMGDRGLAAAA